MKFSCDSRYLRFPVSRYSKSKSLVFTYNGENVLDLNINLDYIDPEQNVYVNIERFKGMELEVACDHSMKIEIQKTDTVDDAGIYLEKQRPYIHYTVKRGWNNDPNGLFYFEGKYHLFYQFNPVGWTWGNMHWGHAVSSDLLHWEEQECALYPDITGTMFSGSAIVDSLNDSGLKENEHNAILLFYTAAGDSSLISKGQKFTQCLAYSTDGGINFKKYDKNPITPHIFGGNRDPKVIYHKQTRHYIMALYLDKNRYLLPSSQNLIHWVKLQEIELENDAECPDFYPLQVDGNPDETLWVLSGASDRYLVGSFDGTVFKPKGSAKRLHYGNNSYASQSWSDMPDGRRVRIAWNTFSIPNLPFSQSMTFPTEMTLKKIQDGLWLFANPIREIEKLYIHSERFTKLIVSSENAFHYRLTDRAYDITLRFSHVEHSVFHIAIFGIEIIGDLINKQITCMNSVAPLSVQNNEVVLRILADTFSIELFINNGRELITNGFIPDYNLNEFEVKIGNGSAVLEELDLHTLKKIW